MSRAQLRPCHCRHVNRRVGRPDRRESTAAGITRLYPQWPFAKINSFNPSALGALTSSIAAVIGGHRDARVHTEAEWSDVDLSTPYEKSKTLAERSAWELVAALPQEQRFELAVINPGTVIGPVFTPDGSTSMEVLRKLVAREVPANARIGFALVDVQDVALAHRLAMERPEAAGNRYICAGDHVWMRDIARTLATELGPRGYRIPTRQMPDWLMWLVARFDPTVRLGLGYLGKLERLSSEKAIRELGWSMRSVRQSIIDAGHSLIEQGLGKRPGRVAAAGRLPRQAVSI